jgi:hypothetical protein
MSPPFQKEMAGFKKKWPGTNRNRPRPMVNGENPKSPESP